MRLLRILYQRKFWITVFIILFLLPVWVFRFFPSQDGPSHLYNAQILQQFTSPNSIFPQYFTLNLSLFPNWLSHLLEWGFLYLAPSLIAEKMLLTLYVTAFPLSFFYFVDAIQPNRHLAGFFSFLFIYNFLVMKGFFSFALAVPLFFFILGYWWKHKDHLGWQKIIFCNLLMGLIFLGHLVPYLLAGFSMVFLALIHFRKQFRPILLTLICILPSGLLLAIYMLNSTTLVSQASSVQFGSFELLLIQLVSLYILVSFNKTQQTLALVTALLMGGMLLYSNWMDWSRRKTILPPQANPRTPFYLLALALIAVYFFAPKVVGSGTMLNERVGLLAVLVLAACFSEGKNRPWQWLAVGFGAFLLINLAWTGYTFRTLNKALNTFVTGVAQIEPNKVLLPILITRNGPSLRVAIFEHAGDYYTLDNGGVNIMNYETQYDYFPVKFRADFIPPLAGPLWIETILGHPNRVDLCAYANRIDYLLVWDTSGSFHPDSLSLCYNLFYENHALKLFKPKP